MSTASSDDIEKSAPTSSLPHEDTKSPYVDKSNLQDQVDVASYRGPVKEDDDNDNDNDLAKDIELPDNAFGRFLISFGRYNRKLEKMLGIEARGIQRVKPEDRTDHRIYGNMFVWFAANCCLPTISIGVLGPLAFGLHLGDSLLTITFFMLLSASLPALCSTFGPRFGLRQMTSSRYAWGYWGAKLVALLNSMACTGWSTANSITGAQALQAVDNFHMSAAVGVVIIAIITLVVGMFGYRIVHWYEKLAWIPTLITCFVMLGVSAKHFVSQPMAFGTAEAASVLSFGGTVWGFGIGWVSMASDYNVYMPENVSSKRVFLYVYAGVVTPCLLLMFLGAAIASAALSAVDAAGNAMPGADPTLVRWYNNYEKNELGGLMYEVLVGPMKGGGKFFLVLLVLSVVANNIINVYSMGLSIAVISHYLAALPRLIWPIFLTAIYIPLAIVGASDFAGTLETFMSILGYWLAIFATVVLQEHFIFRKGKFANYHVETTWNNRHKLPIGLGALAAFCAGAVGVAMGMSVPGAHYTGPIASKFGGDIGFELALGFSAVVFPFARYLELKFVGR